MSTIIDLYWDKFADINDQLETYVRDVRKNIHKEYPSLLKQAQDVVDISNMKGIKIIKVELSGSYSGKYLNEPTEESDIDIKVYYTGQPLNFPEWDDSQIKSELSVTLSGNISGNYGSYDVHAERGT